LEAAKAGDLETVRRIVLSNPHTVNCRDLDGRNSTPLHFAAGYNRVPVVEFLLENGAEVHASDKGELRRWFLPISERIWHLFLTGGLVPLHNACSYGHYEVTELLVKHGANVNVADLWKFTPLHEAAAKGKYDIVKLLLKVSLKSLLFEFSLQSLHLPARRRRHQEEPRLCHTLGLGPRGWQRRGRFVARQLSAVGRGEEGQFSESRAIGDTGEHQLSRCAGSQLDTTAFSR
jgi:ankyrin repeat protein